LYNIKTYAGVVPSNGTMNIPNVAKMDPLVHQLNDRPTHTHTEHGDLTYSFFLLKK